VPNLFKDVFTGVESKRKKALPREMLDRIFNAPLEDPSLRRVQLTVRLMFAFSGIAFVDLAHLKWENIRDGILQYHRQKSGSLIQLEIPSGALRLLDELSACTAKESFYLFPFLSGTRTGEAAYKEYNRTLSRFNHDLKLLARSTGVTLPVTSYTIRHSFASFLKEQDVSIEVISELLGHKSIKTTQIYLKSFSLERLSKVNRNCFESVCKPIPKVG
ncbi:site-specific integrase, partial [Parabacteroides distasonis]